jgi:predicted nucleic acid-binding protein
LIVLDAAAVVDALAGVGDAEDLRERLDVEELNAPTLLDHEVLSSLRGLTRGGHLSVARAEDLLADFEDLPVRRWPFADALRRRVFQLRDSISAYDAAYVALAEALGCPLVTRDARLARSSGHDAQIEIC